MNARQDQICDLALELFYRHGYRKVSMSDIASNAGISRPTLYAMFSNKEALLARLVLKTRKEKVEATKPLLATAPDLRQKLQLLFDLWVIEPYASVLEHGNASELMENCSSYVPEAMADLYSHFEGFLLDCIEPKMPVNGTISAKDVAHILRLATTSLKASVKTVPVLKQLVAGLIEMTMATVEKSFHPS